MPSLGYRWLKRLGYTLTLALGCGLLALWYLWLYYHAPAAPTGSAQVLYLAPGTSVQGMATQLAQAGVIRHRTMFVVYTILTGAATHLQSGEYKLVATMSPAQIIDTLYHGRVMQHTLTIPEGATLREIATQVDTQQLGDQQTLLTLAHNTSFIASVGLAVPSLEGYLFPETYHLPRGTRAQTLLTLMVHTWRHHYRETIAERGHDLGLTPHEVVTLASLIEKEAQVDTERPLIAAVFHNRLRRGMRLQCDATVIYALGAAFDGNLSKTDLAYDSPYNTYRYAGLPPGPIANPGQRSLLAAVTPAAVDYLYFVATQQNGTHQFSATLAEHNRAVQRYQRRTGDN